jgi:hypothetical protein
MNLNKVITALNSGDLLKNTSPETREFRMRGIDASELVIIEIFL